jgi:ParB-like nuclease domain
LPVTWVETRQVALRDLTPFPGNARRGDVAQIQASLRRHGQYRALIIRDTGAGLVILAGNHTAAALEAEHHTEARCEILTCTDEEARRINLADNKIAENATYDDDALVELLSYLDGDYEGSGWDENEVTRLLDTQVGDRPPEPPGDFPGYGDDIDTQYQCPKCLYEWSGKPK